MAWAESTGTNHELRIPSENRKSEIGNRSRRNLPSVRGIKKTPDLSAGGRHHHHRPDSISIWGRRTPCPAEEEAEEEAPALRTAAPAAEADPWPEEAPAEERAEGSASEAPGSSRRRNRRASTRDRS